MSVLAATGAGAAACWTIVTGAGAGATGAGAIGAGAAGAAAGWTGTC